ncbi:hypothetical protein GGR28_003801 [Lewinella aquimaris]|uniref:Apea-like HEPN domain-containing protein n=1 Tax=Neolewinella aquimaris TaxID=1835722 RepID=A0A840EB32_9BACT|nr:hypothetical protein [Neolewinella aquimaris]MBB4081153.1 hypothetical protein [Neolewinella aquimaris]
MKNGKKHYTVNYPGFIGLQDNSEYTISLNGKFYIVKIVSKSLPIVVREFDNEFVVKNTKFILPRDGDQLIDITLKKDISPSFSEAAQLIDKDEFYFIIDSEEQNTRTYSNTYYTKLYLKFEVDDIDDDDESKRLFWKYLHNFVQMYKRASDDFILQFSETFHKNAILIYETTWEYSDSDLQFEELERLEFTKHKGFFKPSLSTVSLADYRTNTPSAHYDLEDNTKALKEITQSEYEYNDNEDWSVDLFIKAKEELFHNKNYKYALLDSFIFIESLVGSLVTSAKIERGLSKSTIKNYEKDIGISYQINIELPLLFPSFVGENKAIISDLNKIRKIRNDIVHKGKVVTGEEAAIAIKTVQKFVDIINKNATNIAPSSSRR